MKVATEECSERGAVLQRFTEETCQNPWNEPARKFTVKAACEAAFLKINFFISEEV